MLKFRDVNQTQLALFLLFLALFVERVHIWIAMVRDIQVHCHLIKLTMNLKN